MTSFGLVCIHFSMLASIITGERAPRPAEGTKYFIMFLSGVFYVRIVLFA